MTKRVLDKINSPEDLRELPHEELAQLSEEIRALIIETMNNNGGHLSSNLGAVELTIALHRQFDFLKNVLLFDVSHQCYTHKIITGRKDRFPTIRTEGGLFGFTNKDESPYDHYTWSHASSSISAGLGIATGHDMAGKEPMKTVCLIGDSALSAGMPFEALSNAGELNKNLLVILNDNKMGIAPAVGAFSKYLNRLRTAPLYNDVRKDLKGLIEKFPRIEQVTGQMREHLINTLAPGHMFESLGFRYFGPVNGHDHKALANALDRVKDIEDVTLLHVLTEKGKGFQQAIDDPYAFHGAKPNFVSVPDASTACEVPGPGAPKNRSYSQAFGDAMIRLAHEDDRIVALTAAMPDGTGLKEYATVHPDKFFDVGICEQHGVAFCSGLSHAGLKPVAAIYSTFLQRAIDQVFHEVTLQNYPVIFAMDRAGLVGADGATAHGLADITYLRLWPNMILMAPRDEAELNAMLDYAKEQDVSCGIRFPRDNVPMDLPVERPGIVSGKSEVLVDGKDGCFFAYGSMVNLCMKARNILLEDGIHMRVINARFAKPLDRDALVKEMKKEQTVFTAEEHWLTGGFGSACMESLELLNDPDIDLRKLQRIGIDDRFIEAATRSSQLKQTGLDPQSIADRVRSVLETPLKV
jgi:1-deoxy-D-xylulose-5-phosphate synthase